MVSVAGLVMLLTGCVSYLMDKPIPWLVVAGGVTVFLGSLLGEEM